MMSTGTATCGPATHYERLPPSQLADLVGVVHFPTSAPAPSQRWRPGPLNGLSEDVNGVFQLESTPAINGPRILVSTPGP